MTSLLVIIILALLSIAIWQLTKIFDLSQGGERKSTNNQIASDDDNKVQGYLMFGFLGFIYLTTIFCLINYGHFPLIGGSSSEHGPMVDNLMVISLVLIFFVQTITQFLLHYFAFKYRGEKGKKAFYFADSNKLEAIWTVIPAIVLAGLILYGLYGWNDIMYVDKEDENDAIVVELYAKQFGWEARYAGKDNVLGKANVRYIEGVNTLGVDMSDPNAQDDIVVNELHLPKGKRVIFKIRSQDVLHSAYMPHFRAQMNCVPGMVTNFSFVPTQTTEEIRATEEMKTKVDNINKIRMNKNKQLTAEGKTPLDPYTFDYLLLCNKICGSSHYNMQMKVVVDTPEDFKKWISDKPSIAKAVSDASKEKAPETLEASKNIDTTSVAKDTAVVAMVEMKK
jgi:cytochrome c oxidase subunit 2